MVKQFIPGKLYTPHRVPLTALNTQGIEVLIRPGTACFFVSTNLNLAKFIREQFEYNYAPEQLQIPHVFLVGEKTLEVGIQRIRYDDWDEYDENWTYLVF